ncbi:hypothetical protein SBA4_7140007 [Candidatus Sulfopaludibacter sp. SbA4]|nr:hypothetical protein SBA4_7140007 [Candidatus Sulfopaludibacter sp. SbA4]
MAARIGQSFRNQAYLPLGKYSVFRQLYTFTHHSIGLASLRLAPRATVWQNTWEEAC